MGLLIKNGIIVAENGKLNTTIQKGTFLKTHPI